MRGKLYRRSGRRAVSVTLSVGVALACAVGWSSVAVAKAPAGIVAAKAPVRATRVQARPAGSARSSAVAHAAGHKIA